MEHIEKLDQAIESFARESNKLAKINELLSSISELYKALEQDKVIFDEEIASLSEMKNNIFTKCNILTDFASKDKNCWANHSQMEKIYQEISFMRKEHNLQLQCIEKRLDIMERDISSLKNRKGFIF